MQLCDQILQYEYCRTERTICTVYNMYYITITLHAYYVQYNYCSTVQRSFLLSDRVDAPLTEYCKL